MQTKLASLILCASTCVAFAQDIPLSAIDWLAVQRDVAPAVALTAKPKEDPVALSATVPNIEVQPLGSPAIGGLCYGVAVVLLCSAMFCYVVLCYAKLCYAMPCAQTHTPGGLTGDR